MLIGVGSLTYTSRLVKQIETTERQKMEIWAEAVRIVSSADLETELASLLLKQHPSGRCRIDHLTDGLHHDDRSFALGAAVLHALGSSGIAEWMEIDHSPGLR